MLAATNTAESSKFTFITSTRAEFLNRLGSNFTRFSIVLLLVLFGSLKWTPEEAKGIYPLVKNSPFMFWLYRLTSVQGGSQVIGVFELITALLMSLRFVSPKLSAFGSLMAIFMFLGTLSFYFTTPGLINFSHGLPALGDQGFILKDLVLLGGAIYTAADSMQAYLLREKKNGRGIG